MEITRDNTYECTYCDELPRLTSDPSGNEWWVVCKNGDGGVIDPCRYERYVADKPYKALERWNKEHSPWNYDKPNKSGWYIGMFYSEYDDQSQNEVYYDADCGEWVMDERHHKGDKLIGWQEKLRFVSPFHIEDCCGCVPALSIWYPEYGENRPASIECEWCCGNEVKLDVSIKDLTHVQRIELVNQWNNLEKKAGEE